MSWLSLAATALLFCTQGCAVAKTVEQADRNLTRDELVMNAVLLHFLSDNGKDAWTLGRAKGDVLLHIRNPEKTGILDQTEGDIGAHKLDKDVLDALRSRNKGKDWESKPFSFEKFRLPSKVHVKDLRKGETQDPYDRFQRFNGFKGYFKAFAPGFSKDGKRAVVRAWVGPSAHGGTVTYSLELRDSKWNVLWRHFAFYA